MIGWIFVAVIWLLGLLFVIQAWSEGAQYWAVIYGAFIVVVLWLSARSRGRAK